MERSSLATCDAMSIWHAQMTANMHCGHRTVNDRRSKGGCDLWQADLCVCQVVALVVMEGETQTALILPQVVAHEVGVLREVDRLQGKPAQALSSVDSLHSHASRQTPGNPICPTREGSAKTDQAGFAWYSTRDEHPARHVHVPHFALRHDLPSRPCCHDLWRQENSYSRTLSDWRAVLLQQALVP